MSLSVIVTSYRSRRILEACLTSLCRQPEARDIVVADCSPDDPSDDLHARFPNVRVVHLPGKVTVPVLRWGAVPATRGGVVAAIEARCVPSDTWCAELLGAHVRWPEAPAVGGPVDLKPDASPFDWGLYFAEFGAFAPPLATGASAQLSGANLSYKRAALIASQDLMDRGQWEAGLHERWRAEGRAPRLSAARVVFHNGMTRGDAMRMRFHYGRSYAADRFADRWAAAWLYAAAGPVLPAVLTFRAAAQAARKGLGRRFLIALPWVVAFNVAWSAGEIAGYLFGRAREAHIY
ncbi:MAG TPA: glycosyltransferase [Vicinamibacterales bacterium]